MWTVPAKPFECLQVWHILSPFLALEQEHSRPRRKDNYRWTKEQGQFSSVMHAAKILALCIIFVGKTNRHNGMEPVTPHSCDKCTETCHYALIPLLIWTSATEIIFNPRKLSLLQHIIKTTIKWNTHFQSNIMKQSFNFTWIKRYLI